MAKYLEAAIFATYSTVTAVIVVAIARYLLSDPIDLTALFIIAVSIWFVNFAIQLILKRDKVSSTA